MKVYIVATIAEGYTTHDLQRPRVISAHDNIYAAETVRKVVGGPSLVFEVEMDYVPPGIRQDAMQLFNTVI